MNFFAENIYTIILVPFWISLLIIVGKDEKINLIVQREDTIKMQLLSEGERNGE